MKNKKLIAVFSVLSILLGLYIPGTINRAYNVECKQLSEIGAVTQGLNYGCRTYGWPLIQRETVLSYDITVLSYFNWLINSIFWFILSFFIFSTLVTYVIRPILRKIFSQDTVVFDTESQDTKFNNEGFLLRYAAVGLFLFAGMVAWYIITNARCQDSLGCVGLIVVPSLCFVIAAAILGLLPFSSFKTAMARSFTGGMIMLGLIGVIGLLLPPEDIEELFLLFGISLIPSVLIGTVVGRFLRYIAILIIHSDK